MAGSPPPARRRGGVCRRPDGRPTRRFGAAVADTAIAGLAQRLARQLLQDPALPAAAGDSVPALALLHLLDHFQQDAAATAARAGAGYPLSERGARNLVQITDGVAALEHLRAPTAPVRTSSSSTSTCPA